MARSATHKTSKRIWYGYNVVWLRRDARADGERAGARLGDRAGAGRDAADALSRPGLCGRQRDRRTDRDRVGRWTPRGAHPRARRDAVARRPARPSTYEYRNADVRQPDDRAEALAASSALAA